MRREQLGAVPSTLTTDCWPLATTCEPASAGSGAATSRARVGREAAEDVREAVGVDACRAARRTAPAPGRGMTLSTPSSSGAVADRARPATAATRSRAARRPARPPAARRTARRTRRRRRRAAAPVRLVIARRRWVPSQPARAWPSTASPKTATSETTHPDRAVGELAGEQRAELQADQRAAEEADERQRADDEALPVAADREHEHQQQQDEVDHGHPFSVRAVPTGPCAASAVSQGDSSATSVPADGAGRVGRRQLAPRGPATTAGPSRPCRAGRRCTPAVKPQTSMPAHLERRPDPAARVADPHPVGRVDQLGDRQPGHVRHLGRAPAGAPGAARATRPAPG